MMKKILALMTSVALLATIAGCADAGENSDGDSGSTINLRYTTYLPENASDSLVAAWWFDRVQELAPEYNIEVKTFFSGSLVKAADSVKAIADGTADIAYMNVPYTPTQLPLSQIGTVPFLTESGEAVARTAAELFETNESFKEEYLSNGVVPVLFAVEPNNTMGFKEPVTSTADFEGLKVRAAGLASLALEKVGSSPVTMDTSGVYETLQQGSLDGFSSIPFTNSVSSFSLAEVAPNFVDSGLGQFTLATNVLMNRGKWESLPKQVQDAMKQASAEAIDENVRILNEGGDVACTALREAGGSVTRLPEDDIAKWKDETLEEGLDTWRSAAMDAGVDQQVLSDFEATYIELVEKYSEDSGADILTQCVQ